MILKELYAQLNEGKYLVSIPDAKAKEFEQAAFKSNLKTKVETHGPLGKYREVKGEKYYSLFASPEEVAKLADSSSDDLAKIIKASLKAGQIRPGEASRGSE